MNKTHSVKKLENGKYEMRTVDADAGWENIIFCNKDVLKETHKSLIVSGKRIEDNISKLNAEIKDDSDIEKKYGKEYTNIDVEKFNELAQLSNSRNNIENRKEQIKMARDMLNENQEKIKRIEVVIPELKR